MRQIKKGSADRSVVIRIIDSADGTPEEGVVYNTAGIDLWYRREGETRTAITEVTLATLASAHADGGFLAIDDGYYRLDLPDAAWLTGASHVMIGGTVTGMIVIGQEVQLVNYDPEDTVRLGLTALPNAAANAAGGLPISAAGGLALDTKLANTNEVTAARMGALTDLIDGGRLDLILDIIAADTTTDIPATLATIAGYLTTEIAEIYAAVITNAAGVDVAADIIAVKAVVDTIVGRVVGTIATGTHNPQSGDAFARLGAPAGASIAADINALPTAAENADAIWDEDVDTTHQTAGTAGKKLDDAGGAADQWSTALPGAYGAGTAGKIIGDNINAPIATIDNLVDAIKAKTDNLPVDPADQSAVEAAITAAHSTTNAYIDTEVAAILADTNTLASRLTAIRAGYLDNLSAGAVALASGVSLIDGAITAIKVATGAIDADALATDAVDEIVDAVWAEILDGAYTSKDCVRLMLAALAGKSNGGGTVTHNYRDMADLKNRVQATVDSNGNRTAVIRDVT